MRKIKIDKYFIDYYLTCGKTRDNFIFENCPIELIIKAEDLLLNSTADAETKACFIKFDREIEKELEKTLSYCDNDFQKSLIARDFFVSVFMEKLLELSNKNIEQRETIKKGIDAILDGDFESVKKYHSHCPMPYDVSKTTKEIGRFELNLFLIGTENRYLQQAINNFISSRERYSIKVFTTNKKLPSYLDQNGNFVQCPHDYIMVKTNDFIRFEEKNFEK